MNKIILFVKICAVVVMMFVIVSILVIEDFIFNLKE
jgi:hypothetical protein